MKGRFTSVCIALESSIFAFSAASFSRCKAQTVGAQIDAGFLLEFVGQIADQPLVEILAAEERVAVGGFHLEHAVADFQHRHVEGAAAEVIDRDGAGALLVHAVGERRRGRLVDDAQNFEARDLAGVFRRLALRVVEVGGNRDDGLRDLLAEIGFGGFLHLLKNEAGDFARRIFLAVAARNPGIAIVGLDDLVGHHADVLLGHRIVEAPADQPLDREIGEFGIGDGLPFGGLADEPFAVGGKGDDGGGGARAFRILDYLGGRALHDSHAGIGGAQVDADDLRHVLSFLPADGVLASCERLAAHPH